MSFSPKGSDAWAKGETLNLSRTGICFCAADAPEINTELQFRLDLEAAGYGPLVANIVCDARVVRRASVGPTWLVGAKLLRYHLEPPQPKSEFSRDA